MRKMEKEGCVVTVREHLITVGFWEFYITTRYPESSRLQEAVVRGMETEIGDVDMDELAPFLRLRTKELSDIMPAPGWSWV